MRLALHHDDPAVLAKRKVIARSWAGIVIGWAIIRTLIVWAAVGDYGLNPWIYLAIDLASACVDAITTPRMVLSFIDDQFKNAAKWALISLVAFILPDLYIFLGTRELPRRIVVDRLRDHLDHLVGGHHQRGAQGARRACGQGRGARRRCRGAGRPRKGNRPRHICLNCGHEGRHPLHQPHRQHPQGGRTDRCESAAGGVGRHDGVPVERTRDGWHPGGRRRHRRHVGARPVRGRSGAVEPGRHRQPARHARQAVGVVLHVRPEPR